MRLDRRTFLFGSAATAALVSATVASAPMPVRSRRLRGLSAAIEIVDDRAGIPHIRAETKPDAFFGQGYVVARDRLFQLDLGHRRELGRMAEAFGPAFVDHDHAERLFHFRGDLAAELASVPPEVLACATAYVAGINARIDEVLANRSLLPAEYAILDAAPLRWDVDDFVRGRGASTGNADEEIRRARLAALGRLDLDRLFLPPQPERRLRVPEGLDVAAVSEADLGLLARLEALPFGVSPTPVTDPAAARADRATAEADAWAGSNAWTIAPGRTATGRPILANDPHLGIGGFGPRHVAHLSAPGLDVIGGGAPGLPGIMQGHTDRFAFGRTNSHNDQSDLFVLELDPADPERYRHAGGWKRFVTYEDDIAVKGAGPRRVRIRHSVHGPVLRHDPAARRATAVSAVQLMPGAMGGFAMIAINLSRGWEDLQAAFRLHPSPTNFHYADVDGNHGWQVIGHVPIRGGGHDGLLPVPGDGRFDWTGRYGAERLPSAWNPPAGWFASANQNNFPADFPMPPAFSYREPYRYQRIASVLERQPRHSLADSAALMQDVWSVPARRFAALIPPRIAAPAEPAAAVLRGWDGHLRGESGQAALFQIVWKQVTRRLREAIVPVAVRPLVPSIATGEVLRLLAAADPQLGWTLAARDRLLADSLAAGWTEARERMGADPAGWRWDGLHRVRIAHPLARLPAIAAAFPAIDAEGPAGGSAGDNFTVNARWVARGGGYHVTGAASYLQAIDVGDWDASLYLNMPGQSADPASPHYRDHFAPWIAGRMQPLPFTRAAVDAAAVRRTRFIPA